MYLYLLIYKKQVLSLNYYIFINIIKYNISDFIIIHNIYIYIYIYIYVSSLKRKIIK